MSILQCTHCGKMISRLEWESFRFSDTYRCCNQMNLLPVRDKAHVPVLIGFMQQLELTAKGGENAYLTIGSREYARELYDGLASLGVPTK